MTISKDPPFINVIGVTVKIWRKERPQTITITARQIARTILALSHQGQKGITALEMGTWAFRLGAYIHILRHDYSLHIETIKEEHNHGWHGRYLLHTHVEILEIITK